MKKVLSYKQRLFLNARSFHEFILETEFDGNEPNNFKLGYVAVCFTHRQKTIAGFKVDWVLVDLVREDALHKSETGWIRYTEGPDECFMEFVVNKKEQYTKEILWRWVIDYVSLYDQPRSHMKRLVDDVLTLSCVVEKKNGVNVYYPAL